MVRASLVFVLGIGLTSCSPAAPSGPDRATSSGAGVAPSSAGLGSSAASSSAGAPSALGASGPASTPSAGAASGANVSVTGLIGMAPRSGTFTVVAYVANIALCGACPPGAACKPCMDTLVVSDAPKTLSSAGEAAPTDLLVRGDRAQIQALTPGQRYRFELEIGPHTTTSRPFPDPNLKSAVAAP